MSGCEGARGQVSARRAAGACSCAGGRGAGRRGPARPSPAAFPSCGCTSGGPGERSGGPFLGMEVVRARAARRRGPRPFWTWVVQGRTRGAVGARGAERGGLGSPARVWLRGVRGSGRPRGGLRRAPGGRGPRLSPCPSPAARPPAQLRAVLLSACQFCYLDSWERFYCLPRLCLVPQWILGSRLGKGNAVSERHSCSNAQVIVSDVRA